MSWKWCLNCKLMATHTTHSCPFQTAMKRLENVADISSCEYKNKRDNKDKNNKNKAAAASTIQDVINPDHLLTSVHADDVNSGL